MNRTCEEYVLNELEKRKNECASKDKVIEELNAKNSELRNKVVSLNATLSEKQKALETIAKLIGLKAGTFNDEPDGLQRVSAYNSFSIWEDDDNEAFNLLKPYAVSEGE